MEESQFRHEQVTGKQNKDNSSSLWAPQTKSLFFSPFFPPKTGTFCAANTKQNERQKRLFTTGRIFAEKRAIAIRMKIEGRIFFLSPCSQLYESVQPGVALLFFVSTNIQPACLPASHFRCCCCYKRNRKGTRNVKRKRRNWNKNYNSRDIYSNTSLSLARIALSSDASCCYEYMLTSYSCLLYTSPSPRDRQKARMPSSA